MIKSVHEYSMHQLFDPETKVKYYVPRYQREYSWKQNNWEDLFNDLDEEKPGYYLGTILLVNQSADGLKPNCFEIIDGQQRLLTISIIYAAIYKRMLNLAKDNSNNEDFIREKLNLKDKLFEKHKSDPELVLKFVPQEQNNNLVDYTYLLFSIEKPFDNREKPKNYGNRKIFKASNYFDKRIQDYNLEKLMEFLNKINNTLVVKIEVNNYSDAYVLFQSLNNRGAPLLATDLIKTSMLSEMEKQNIMTLDVSYDKWQQIINNITEGPAVNERFLRHYYNAYKNIEQFKEVAKNFSRATQTNLIEIYNDNLIPNNPSFLFDELLCKSKVYGKLVTGQYDGNDKINSNLRDLLHVRGAPSYAFLLYLISEFDDQVLIENVTELIVKWYARRNLTDYPPTRDLDSIFIKLIEKCRERNTNEITTEFISKELIQYMDNIDDVMTKLHGDLYSDNPDITRFLLSKIEESHMTKERKVDLWQRGPKGLVFTIEHIFPEGSNIPKDWIDVVASGDTKLAKELQEQYVHKIGNLTLTAYNPNLSNLSFEKKRDRIDPNGNSIGYKNGFYLNCDLKDKKTWDVKEIKNRGDKLVAELISFLKFANE